MSRGTEAQELRLAGGAVGSPFAGRLHPATRDMVGCCINILPLRLRLAGLADVRALVQRVRAFALAAFGNAEASLPAISAAIGRSHDDPALYQVRPGAREHVRCGRSGRAWFVICAQA